MIFDSQPVIDRMMFHENDGNYPTYRIPGLIAHSKNVLFACVEARSEYRSDWGKIDVLVCRSVDGGRNWQTIKKISSEDNKKQTINNPTLVSTGDTVILLYCLNYSRAFVTVSNDCGENWTTNKEITSTFRSFDYDWNVCATGPGHGIYTKNKRIIVPIWLAYGIVQDDGSISHWPSVAGYIYSTDKGTTWIHGDLAFDLPDGNENAVCELYTGDILFNFRTRSKNHKRSLAKLEQSTGKFVDQHEVYALDDPICFGSMVSFGNDSLIQVNCNSKTSRQNLQLKISFDQGSTWENDIVVDDIGGYADLAATDNLLYVLYERQLPENKHVTEIRLKAYRAL